MSTNQQRRNVRTSLTLQGLSNQVIRLPCELILRLTTVLLYRNPSGKCTHRRPSRCFPALSRGKWYSLSANNLEPWQPVLRRSEPDFHQNVYLLISVQRDHRLVEIASRSILFHHFRKHISCRLSKGGQLLGECSAPLILALLSLSQWFYAFLETSLQILPRFSYSALTIPFRRNLDQWWSWFRNLQASHQYHLFLQKFVMN